MPQMTIPGPTFHSSKDEASFFSWLQSIPGVTRVVGAERSLQVTLRSSRLGSEALRDMLALHWRYRLPMRDLAQFWNATNEHWFAAPEMYWHESVFGATA